MKFSSAVLAFLLAAASSTVGAEEECKQVPVMKTFNTGLTLGQGNYFYKDPKDPTPVEVSQVPCSGNGCVGNDMCVKFTTPENKNLFFPEGVQACQDKDSSGPGFKLYHVGTRKNGETRDYVGLVAGTGHYRYERSGAGEFQLEGFKLASVEICTSKPKPSASGDPHFVTFGGKKYDFHGGCDLVLLQNPTFANGLGLNIHIRTHIKASWSHIKAAVVQLGRNTLEVTAEGNDCILRFNGEKEGHQLEAGEASLGDYAVKFTRINDHQTRSHIDLGKGNAVTIETFKEFAKVILKPHDDLVGSFGMLGSYPAGDMVGRDGVSIIGDANEFGQEWRVRAVDSLLFHDADGYLDTCPMPDPAASMATQRRRLGESALSEEDAATACARVDPMDRDACTFDVLATNDKEMAGSY